ncbi:DUF3320 domain-containing protein [Thalassoroseus pseudoceratinae]|uniref:DUF3320 domain-containing protein n=1 Tax=Thalassoroseus pseudoceratinae TaxID=2713176 RepID=UPI00142224C2|nr:DUF3320 domain-containing protein [Thalassoroseus pseudoceratinae]
MTGDRTTGLTIHADLTDCINYASWQNSVPLLRSLELQNESGQDIQSSNSLGELSLQLTTSPAFTRPKQWMIQRIAAGEQLTIRDRDVQLDSDYLNGLNEAERGRVTLRLQQGDTVLSEVVHDIRVLARDEWGGLGSMSELLAAFVMPNDPSLAPILKSAGKILGQHGHSTALDGYQRHDPQRAYLLAAAIWSAVAERSLTYANPPSSFEQKGQKVRRPSTVLRDGLATCLDSTLLFAAAMEAIGLNPVIVMTDGHCFVGVWLVERSFDRLIETDCSEVRKAIAAKELITFETTLVTHNPPARFQDAIQTAEHATRESNESQYLATIDIKRARMAQFRPLASHDKPVRDGIEPVETSGPLPLPAVPDLGHSAMDVSEVKPTTPEGRIERWQRKLLDLSLRNRLLNFKLNKQSIPLVCPDISRLEDRLGDGTKLRMISLSDHNPIGERDAELHRQKTNQELDTEFAKQALARDEIACDLTEDELAKRLTTLYRNVRNDLAEGGSNTLFLAVGFLKWKQKPDDTKSYRAPLLLVPVKLIRKSALSPYHLAQHEDEIRFNATLIQLLKKDFDRDLSWFEGDLPTDESGVDVPQILSRMRAEVRDIPGFEVVDESALGTFSFAKYLMWKDLVDRVDQLEQNRVVRHLIRDPGQPFDRGAGTIPHPQEVDQRFEPQEIYHPLPADSSQLAAVMAASEGQDFVLIGPPGTGKSQTIANIISQCLAVKKTVLFVAEKTAALDVVYRRLKEHGLGDCCLELHSSKAERRKFLDQLEGSWLNNQRAKPNEWLTINERLKIRRDELNAYVSAIHTQHPNGWTVYEAMGECVKGREIQTPEFDWADSVEHDTDAYWNLTTIIDELARTYSALDSNVSLPAVKTTQWSAGWEAKLLAECEQLKEAATAFRQALSSFSKSVGLPEMRDCLFTELDNLNRFATALVDCVGDDLRIIFNKQFAKLPAAASELATAIEGYQEARERAAANYDESLESIPIDDIDTQWRQAVASFWPMSWFARRKVTRLLQSYATSGQANPASDISAIRQIRQHSKSIENSPLAEINGRWNAHETDVKALRQHLDKASGVRQAIRSVGRSSENTNAVLKTIYPILAGQSVDSPILEATREFLAATKALSQSVKSFRAVSDGTPISRESSEIATAAIDAAQSIQRHRTQLQRWTAWCGIKKQAKAVGLNSFRRDLENRRIAPSEMAASFRVAYARWWVTKAIDRSPVLQSFQRFKHEDAIQDFRKLDDLARETAASQALQAVAHQLPAPDSGVPRKSELGLLRHQMNLKRPSKSIREVISNMPETFGKLAPCLLMSPLSIAQYLPADQAIFDVVIFDEASQITTWDAIGAIARGQQTIIVGDPKQLPPTNFFGRVDDDETNDELEDHEKDLESILDEAKASGLPTLLLNWHYRSRHESLIAFSNYNYYGNKLVTFPAAESEDRGVSFCHQPGALYDRGKSRTNRQEAEAIVRDAVARMKRNLELPETDRLTFGVITFNSQQQTLIQDLFDQAQREHPELDWYFADERIEPTVVKNLENVQGDERDVMFFSITFGQDATGRPIPLTFGALNRDGGERRLNVAVTRARQELLVYSSFTADQLNAERSQARGVRDLKAFLEYAEKGPRTIQARTDGSVGGLESAFEEAVAEALDARGWQVVPQVGVSGFRVDLGIRHPDKPGAYLAGVECDGATYHRSAVARDRDKTRQQVLENLGWNILRVWSPDWWYDSANAIEQLHNALNVLLRTQREIDEETSAVDDRQASHEVEPADFTESMRQNGESTLYYQRSSLPDASHAQDQFFDAAYDEPLRQMARSMLDQEAPIRDDVLAKQIARLHGFARTGAKIRNRILELLTDVPSNEESTGRFLWSGENPLPIIEYRHPLSDEDKRSIDEISIAELRGLLEARPELATDSDPAIAMARTIGFARLSQSARERLEEAIKLFLESKN